MLKLRPRRYAASLALFLSACQSLPTEEAPVHSCPEVEVPECPVCVVPECPPPTTAVDRQPAAPAPSEVASGNGALPVVGALEWALVEPSDLILEARIDTGAETSSIHAEDIQLVEKDGKRYVRFALKNPDNGELVNLERRLHRRILVKQTTDAPPDRRYVVRLWVTLGDKRTWLDVSLTDRTDFDYPLLLGRNMLLDEFIVDVSRRHTQTRRQLEKARQ
jgi:hypothetical protein